MSRSKLKGFTFYRSYLDAIRGLQPEQKYAVIEAMMIYAFDSIEPSASETDPVVFALFCAFKPNLDNSISKALNGSKKGKKEKQKLSEKKQNGSEKKQTRSNDKDKDKDKDKDSDKTERLTAWFEKVWEMYGRKGNKQDALGNWLKLSEASRVEVEERIPAYVRSVSEKKYLKDFSGWLNPSKKRWLNEIVPQESSTQSHKQLPEDKDYSKGW